MPGHLQANQVVSYDVANDQIHGGKYENPIEVMPSHLQDRQIVSYDDATNNQYYGESIENFVEIRPNSLQVRHAGPYDVGYDQYHDGNFENLTEVRPSHLQARQVLDDAAYYRYHDGDLKNLTEVRPIHLQARQVGSYDAAYIQNHNEDLRNLTEVRPGPSQARQDGSYDAASNQTHVGDLEKLTEVGPSPLQARQVGSYDGAYSQYHDGDLHTSIEDEKGDLQPRNIEPLTTNLQREIVVLGRFIKAKANQLKDKQVESLATTNLQSRERELGNLTEVRPSHLQARQVGSYDAVYHDGDLNTSIEDKKGDLQPRNIEPSTTNLQREIVGLGIFNKAKANQLKDKQMESLATTNLQSRERELGSHEQQKLHAVEQIHYGHGNFSQQSAHVRYYLDRGVHDRPHEYSTDAGRARAMLALKLGNNPDRFGSRESSKSPHYNRNPPS